MCLRDGALSRSGLGFGPAAEEEEQPGHRGFNYRPKLGTSMETVQLTEDTHAGSTVSRVYPILLMIALIMYLYHLYQDVIVKKDPSLSSYSPLLS